MIEFSDNSVDYVQYQQVTLNNLIANMPTMITLDIAPHHTGIVCWDGTKLKEHYFRLTEPDKLNAHWLYLLRQEFKQKLLEIVKDQTYEYCLVEDIYGGENFDTVVQLVTLNNVIDEIMFEGNCNIKTFYRLKPTAWMSKARKIYKQEGKLKSKFETQGLLDYLQCEYYLQNKELTKKEKEDCCFEDICDAYGMMVAIISDVKLSKTAKAKSNTIKFSDVKMAYVEYLTDCKFSRDKRFKYEDKVEVDLKKNIKESIMDILKEDTENKVFYAELPVSKLGAFGMKYGFTFYESGQGYLVFYLKQHRREI